MTGSVGDRMAALFRGDEPPDHAYVTDRATAPSLANTGRVGPYPEATPILALDLPIEVGDRIRDMLRAGDLEGAAELGRMALDSLGIDPAPELQTGAQTTPVKGEEGRRYRRPEPGGSDRDGVDVAATDDVGGIP